jgi:inner membrane protein
MSPVTHFFAGWLLASATPLSRREKAAVVIAGVVPDLDGLGIIPELLTRPGSATARALSHIGISHPLPWFSEYHHSLHTLAFALAVTVAAYFCSQSSDFTFGPAIHKPSAPPRPIATALLAFLSFHLHLFCDLMGSRGPDGYSWPIPYLAPFSRALTLSWHGQWTLNGWQNIVITTLLLVFTLWITTTSESSPLELVSESANRRLVSTLRSRFHRRPTRSLSS